MEKHKLSMQDLAEYWRIDRQLALYRAKRYLKVKRLGERSANLLGLTNNVKRILYVETTKEELDKLKSI